MGLIGAARDIDIPGPLWPGLGVLGVPLLPMSSQGENQSLDPLAECPESRRTEEDTCGSGRRVFVASQGYRLTPPTLVCRTPFPFLSGQYALL